MALGADRRDVLALVLRRGLRLAIPGLLFGLASGLALARLIRGFTLNIAPAIRQHSWACHWCSSA